MPFWLPRLVRLEPGMVPLPRSDSEVSPSSSPPHVRTTFCHVSVSLEVSVFGSEHT